ncbi:MAG: type II 3-dehydroquinate dehydratase [Granulosicoccus sp.]
MSQVLVLNGPNLNLLGTREPEKYGKLSLADIERELYRQAQETATTIEFFQSNSEGALIDRVHKAGADGVGVAIINPAGYTHTSVPLRDAFLGVALPLIEVHLSNIYQREPFRHHSYFSDIAIGTLAGFGASGYNMALSAAVAYLHDAAQKNNP